MITINYIYIYIKVYCKSSENGKGGAEGNTKIQLRTNPLVEKITLTNNIYNFWVNCKIFKVTFMKST